MPNNHSKYGTSTCFRVYGTAAGFQRQHGRPGVKPPDTLGGKPFHLHPFGGKERAAGQFKRVVWHSVQDHLPPRHLQVIGQRAGLNLGNAEHVKTRRQGGVEAIANVVWQAARGQRNLQILGLARRAGRHGGRVGQFWMRVEPTGVGDGQFGLAQCPLDGTRDIPMAREPQPAALGEPDAQPLHRLLRCRTWWSLLLPAHQRLAGSASSARRRTVSGNSLAPVGPVWISVPMAGQTPQS